MCSPGFRTTVSAAQEHINLCRWSEPAQNILVPCQFTTGALCKPQEAQRCSLSCPFFPHAPSDPHKQANCSIAVEVSPVDAAGNEVLGSKKKKKAVCSSRDNCHHKKKKHLLLIFSSFVSTFQPTRVSCPQLKAELPQPLPEAGLAAPCPHPKAPSCPFFHLSLSGSGQLELKQEERWALQAR